MKTIRYATVIAMAGMLTGINAAEEKKEEAQKEADEYHFFIKNGTDKKFSIDYVTVHEAQKIPGTHFARSFPPTIEELTIEPKETLRVQKKPNDDSYLALVVPEKFKDKFGASKEHLEAGWIRMGVKPRYMIKQKLSRNRMKKMNGETYTIVAEGETAWIPDLVQFFANNPVTTEAKESEAAASSLPNAPGGPRK